MPASAVPYSSYPGPTRPPPPPPPVPLSAPPTTSNAAPPEDRVSKDSSHPAVPGLKTVSLPRECLPRFLAIAKVNTSNNKETCGLLLGKDKGHKFVVTTLLIPKQHSTSDTCTMDEEELVLQFTEERSLITLGWVGVFPGLGSAATPYTN
jgi:STAM-binding protein